MSNTRSGPRKRSSKASKQAEREAVEVSLTSEAPASEESEPAAVSAAASSSDVEAEVEANETGAGLEAPASLVPASVEELRALYSTDLGEVQFPDVSAAILDRAAAELDEKGRARDAARAELEQAEAAVAAARTELLRLAERGLAYARVYAAEDPALSERLGQIKLESERRRGRVARKPRTSQGSSSNGSAQRPRERQPTASA